MSLRFRMSAIVIESDENWLLEILGGKMFLEKVSNDMHKFQAKLKAYDRGNTRSALGVSVRQDKIETVG